MMKFWPSSEEAHKFKLTVGAHSHRPKRFGAAYKQVDCFDIPVSLLRLNTCRHYRYRERTAR